MQPLKLSLQLIVGIILIATVGLTVAMRGQLSEKTYSIVEGKDFIAKTVFPVPSEPTYIEDSGFQRWFPSGEPRPIVTESSGMLYMIAGFFENSNRTQAPVMQKNLDLTIPSQPFFSMRLFVPTDVKYGVRFWGLTSEAEDSEFPLWNEASPLEHRTGNEWETLQIDLRAYSIASLGTIAIRLTKVYLYMETPPMSRTSGIRSLILEQWSLSPVELLEQPPVPGFNTYSAVVSGISEMRTASWGLERVTLYVQVRAAPDTPLEYSVYVTDLRDIFEPTSTSNHYQVKPGDDSLGIVEVNTFRASYVPLIFLGLQGDLAIVVRANQGSFEAVTVNSIQMIFTRQGLHWDVQPDSELAGLLTILILSGTILVPVAAVPAIYHHYSKKEPRRMDVLMVVATALALRFVLAPLGGHAWDMEQWTQHARLYYESGDFTLARFPTLPMHYFLLLGSYSWYALLRTIGLSDFSIMFQPTGFFESIFIKTPMILADGVSFLAIFQILSQRIGSLRAIVYASVFAFNPLSIFISSVWGMYDSIMVAFLLLGLEKLQSKNHLRSSIWFSLATLTKLLGAFPLLIGQLDLLLARKFRLLLLTVTSSTSVILGILSLQWGEFFYNTFLQRILGVASVVRPLVGGAVQNPFANPTILLIVEGGLQVSRQQLYVGFAAFLALSVLVFLRSVKHDTLVAVLSATLVATAGYYLFFVPVNVPHYSWIVPILVLYLSLKQRNVAGTIPIMFGLVAVIVGISSTVSFGYFVVGAPYIQIPALENSIHHIAVFGFMVLVMLGMPLLSSLPWIRELPARSAAFYLSVLIINVFVLSYLVIPFRLSG